MTLFHETIINDVREQAVRMESSGTLSPEILAFIYEAKLFKLFVPKELGGLAVDLPAALRIFEKASWVDGSFGWLITIGSGGGFFSATLFPELARKLFADPKAVVAGSGHPSGTAKETNGGYLVTGQWKYCSGSTYASFFTANCIVEWEQDQEHTQNAAEAHEIRSFVFMPEQVTIIRDWNAFGLKATESHSIAVKNVFVPKELTFDILSKPNYDAPIFKYPFLPFAQTSFAAVTIGIWRHYLEEARHTALEQRAAWDKATPRRFPAVIRAIEEQERLFADAADAYYQMVEASWGSFVKEGGLSEQDQQEVGRVSQDAARMAVACAHRLFPLMGMSALMEDRLLNRIWRDLHTVTQHSVLVPLE
jgi:alkylation response protein AidB-like acyl-CoA dehydrogenase